MNVYDDIVDAMRAIEALPPRATKLECGHAVWQLIADESRWENEQLPPRMPWQPSLPTLPIHLIGVEVHVLPDLPVKFWRFLDQHGGVIGEGTLE